MDTRPTLDKSYKVKASRPGWKALAAFVIFFAAMASFLHIVEI
jgi:hypothetical protein